jgi:CubicO group peptidase (beta-lactamase class C family)
MALLSATPALADDAPLLVPRDEAELRQRLEGILHEHHVAGLGVVINDRAGLRWTAGIGKANVRTGADATPDTLFRVGSISKMWVALAALKLASEGKLSLDATVRSLAPDVAFENPWEATDPVRFVHLLEHTTGWDDLGFRDWASNDPKPLTLKEGLDFHPRTRSSRWRPGTRYSYSNAGPAVAAYILEKITGKTFEDHVAEAFFKPLDMPTASFLLTPETGSRLSRLYRDDGTTEYPYLHFIARPSGSLNASPREMSHFLGFLLARGSVGEARILPAAALDRMETPTTYLGAQAGLKTGYGLNDFTTTEEGGFVWHGHNGGLDGARADLAYLPDAGVGFFFAMNGDDHAAFKETSQLLRAYVSRDLPKPALPPAASTGPELSLYAGWYEYVSPRDEWQRFVSRLYVMAHVRASEGGLAVWSFFGPGCGEYVAVTPTLFRRPKDPVATLALVPLGAEARMIQTDKLTWRAIPTWMAWTQIATMALTLVLMLSVPLLALVWVPRKLAGRLKGVKHLGARILHLGAVGAVVVAVALFVRGEDADLGLRTPLSMGLTACTVLFALCSFGSLAAIARAPRREVHPVAYVHTWLTSAVLSVMAVYLTYWGFIGIRTWV